ncbi:hypothetical protein [Streptomyces sp. NPDC058954]|uniref:hypothetical protein n=1 Tax=Streptomyces sp. NPDC058954 TaxID=3346677 RepID=UPI0036C32981
MKVRLPRLATTATAAGLAVCGLVAMPGTASAAAASKCSSEQHKEFDTLGYNLDVYVTLCVHRDSSNNYKATAKVTWQDGGQGNSGGMEKLWVQVRLEHNDSDIKTNTTSYTNLVNSYESSGYTIETDEYHSTSTGGWTADGHVVYNVDLDGDGEHTWSLGGSPSI